MKQVVFCDLIFKGLNKAEILNNRDPFQHIVTVGAEFIIEAHKNDRLKSIINENISTFDGQVPYLFAKARNKQIAFEKISGADFIYDICWQAKEKNERIFLLGGTTTSNPGSIKMMNEMGITAKGYVTGFISYPFVKEDVQCILQQIREFKPHYLLVGLGMGKQEFFIQENKALLQRYGVKLAMGCGGTFEVFSGDIKRAPKWMQRIGLEGCYRFLAAPSLTRLKRLMSTIKFIKYL